MSDPRLDRATSRVAAVRQDFGAPASVTALADALADLIDAVRDLAGRQVAPVVPLARGPLDFQPEAAITLATVVPPDADAAWWADRIVPMTEDES